MMLFVIQLAPFINKDRSRRGTHRRLPELRHGASTGIDYSRAVAA